MRDPKDTTEIAVQLAAAYREIAQGLIAVGDHDNPRVREAAAMMFKLDVGSYTAMKQPTPEGRPPFPHLDFLEEDTRYDAAVRKVSAGLTSGLSAEDALVMGLGA